MRRDIHEEIMHATWLATTACCTALHDIGFDTEEIAEEMPEAMSKLANGLIERRYGALLRSLLPGDAIKAGQDYAERLAAKRVGVTA